MRRFTITRKVEGHKIKINYEGVSGVVGFHLFLAVCFWEELDGGGEVSGGGTHYM